MQVPVALLNVNTFSDNFKRISLSSQNSFLENDPAGCFGYVLKTWDGLKGVLNQYLTIHFPSFQDVINYKDLPELVEWKEHELFLKVRFSEKLDNVHSKSCF